ncbi:aminotransferase class I/II-fold pyridoxal phosphate-dependent enzyme [Desulforamulus putei]|uniref:Aminotransferase class I and II n=1 Tax=Desulforamulus putei DSM 12395 TaxID=1121429 RepID=A0A1M4WCF9_9FIRM|nr:aminotransferase class I/II-fold pyridoxal phosphate-dependent enzyme [Desulforamulus putei]SHE78652.1 Aminotransferase class I and II [Desulforamulus putei DSM 12395]
MKLCRIVDGIILNGAEHRRYKHRDLVSLENILKNCGMYRRKLIITDTVFSMDGYLAPLKEIVQLKEQYGALLMVDEAHGGGVFGSSGRDLAEAAGVSEAIDINMGTLSKAFGGAGAYVAGSRVLIDYLRNISRTLIYTTPCPLQLLRPSVIFLSGWALGPGVWFLQEKYFSADRAIMVSYHSGVEEASRDCQGPSLYGLNALKAINRETEDPVVLTGWSLGALVATILK